MRPIEIIIADDHLMVREGLKQLLELDGDIKVIGEATDGFECLKLIEKLNPEVVLLDINMPNMNGIEVLEQMKKRNMDAKVLVLTIHNEIEYLFRTIDIGINGYVLKDSDSSVLKTAIYEVYNGNTYIQASMAPLLKEKILNESVPDASYSELLSKRELQVLELVAEGLFNKEIAYKLSISEKTVKNHVSNIFKKIHVSDRTQAAVYAIRNNIVEIS
jgi:Response regulator containing a CheY-like receiver domain and an HTH DNA-binding domain